MSDSSDEQRDAAANEGVDEAVRSKGGEGEQTARVTPPLADEAKHGQTQSPAPADDVGVPSDEELSREEQ